MRWIAFGTVVFLGVLLAACSVFVPGGADLDSAVAAFERTNPPKGGRQRLYAAKPATNGALVIYRTIASQTPFSIDYMFMTGAGTDWQMREGGGIGKSVGSLGNAPIMLSLDAPDPARTHSVVVGLVVDARIRSVQLELADGRGKNDTAVNDMFGIFIEPQSAVCRIVLRDGQNNVLFDYKLEENPAELDLSPDIVEWAKRECE